MKKFLGLILCGLLFIGCASKPTPQPDHLIETKVNAAVTLEQLKALEKDNEREVAILEKLDNTVTYGFGLLDELEFSIAYEKQQAFNEGYDAGKKDAINATDGYIKLEDVIELLRKQGLLKEE